MKRFAALLLILALLCASPALADIGGEGWWSYGEYPGSWVMIESTGLYFRLPSGWADWSDDGEGHIYQPVSGTALLHVYKDTENTWDHYQEQANRITPDGFEEGAFIILQQDRDWLVFAGSRTLMAVAHCEGGYSGVLVLYFDYLSTENDWIQARQIAGSVRSF